MTQIKTTDELYYIAKASALGDLCFEHILTKIKPGVTELEISNEIQDFLLTNGGEELSFPTICVSGANGALPHGEPSDKKIQKGDFLTMDFGVKINGYCSDMTRTVAIGSVTEEMRKVYDTVLTAQKTALSAVRTGALCFDIDKIARDIIDKAGYGEFYIHGTGHGVGTEVHEPPTLNAKSDEVLAENMAVTVEPGIYIPDKMGVRIEDLAIVTDFGIINLVNSNKELIII